MSVRRSRARRGISDRWVPSVLRVTLVLVLVVGLAGLAIGTYIFSGHDLVGRSGPSVAVPLSPGAVGDGAGSSSAGTAAASAAADSSRPSDTPAPAAAQTRVTAAKVTAKGSITTTTPASANSPFEQQVLALTNAQRTAAGCPTLTWNATLASVARAHSQDMAAKNYFDHNTLTGTTPAQRLTAVGYTYRQMAENIAAGQATPADVMASWMNSAGHKANILNCALTELGVGYATGGTYRTYWTQDFGTR